LLWHLQRRGGGGRGAVVSVRTRDVCGVDRRCGMAVRELMMRLVGRRGSPSVIRGGVYLIEREALEEVLSALREWI